MMENHNTVYGGGATVTYYPPGAGQSALTPVADMVNSPSHYTQGGIETMIFVVEYSGGKKIDVLLDVNEIDTTPYKPVEKLFICETMDETKIVIDELLNARA